MPSDSELRDRFRSGTLPHGEIDVDAVIRRARARRRPRVMLAGAGSVLAIAAIAVPAVLVNSIPGAGGGGAALTTVDGAAADEPAPESAAGGAADSQAYDAVQRKAAGTLNACGEPAAEAVPAESGLVVTVAPVDAAATDRGIPVIVTLTNAGEERVTGTTGARPTVTFAGDGVVLWHTNGPEDLVARVVDLAPGQSMSYRTTFEPVVCGPADDAAEGFRPDLPGVGPGRYTLSAAIDVAGEDGSTTELVTGPTTSITLR